jgi:5-methyltetrahydropteroyltriglutamate--homocysteine methyltransferase
MVAAMANRSRSIRTTHVGSLPRGKPLSERLMRRETGDEDDLPGYRDLVGRSVVEVVQQQVDIGIDVVSDGEMSKITYATYVKDRLSGFGGDSRRRPALDMADHPEYARRMAEFAGEQKFKRQTCVGPIANVGHDDLQADLTNLRTAADSAGATDCFMNAASPGLVSAFQDNAHYPTHEEYVVAIGDAMQVEYEAIVAAGFQLQLDCPDLAMARHTGFQHLTDSEFVDRAEHNVDVLNHAVRNIAPESMRMHVCWGNYEGPHDHDIALEQMLPTILRARPSAILFEASNPRHAHEWIVWRDADLPDDKVLVPGVITSTSNYVDHPELVAQRIATFVAIVGADRVIAGTDCGFGTFAGLGKIDAEIAYKKLASLVAGAELASNRLSLM